MKKILFVLLLALLIGAPNIVFAGEPKPDLSGEISPSQSWILHTNEVWELPAIVADLVISPVTGTLTVEIETKEIAISGDTVVPEDNKDVSYRRIKPVGGDVYLWATAGTYKITGWASVSGVAVVKTGPLGQQGPPPPGNVSPTPEPPTPTAAPPEPTPTPLPPEPTPMAVVATAEEIATAMKNEVIPAVINTLMTDQGFLEATKGEEGDKGEQGPPGPGISVADVVAALKGDQAFLNSITPGVVVDYNVLAADLKTDKAFVDSLRPAEPVIITPQDVITDVGKYLVAHHAAGLKGEQGPVGEISDTLLLIILVAAVLAFAALGLVAWNIYYARGLPDCEWVNTAIQALSTTVQTKIDTAVGVAKNEMNKKISDCATADSVRRAITDLEQKISRLVELTQDYATKQQMVEAIRALQFQLEQQIAQIAATSDQTKGHLMLSLEGLKEQLATLEAEIAPLSPRPVTTTATGAWKCPGCNKFVARITEGISGRCKDCGTSYIGPQVVAEEVEEVAAEAVEAS